MRKVTKIFGAIAMVAAVVWSARDRFVEVPTSGPTETPPSPPHQPSTPVTEITGIGPAYAGRLADMGITDVHSLAKADPDLVAGRVEVTRERAGLWIERAAELR